ncbi:hypothetical protein D9M72_419710 [compost metagenome]
MMRIDGEPQGDREGGAEDQRRDEDDRERRDEEACAHAGKDAASDTGDGRFRAGLQRRQPGAEQGKLGQRHEAGQRDEQAEGTPGIR